MKNAARNLVKDKGFVADVDGVPRVCPALIPHHPSGALGENVDELPLPFIPPLRSDNDDGARL